MEGLLLKHLEYLVERILDDAKRQTTAINLWLDGIHAQSVVLDPPFNLTLLGYVYAHPSHESDGDVDQQQLGASEGNPLHQPFYAELRAALQGWVSNGSWFALGITPRSRLRELSRKAARSSAVQRV